MNSYFGTNSQEKNRDGTPDDTPKFCDTGFYCNKGTKFVPIGEVANSGDFSGTDDPAAELIKIVETRKT